jgi:succinate dehydrogenase/fumarate reductase flavoprotein subunit
LRSLAEQRVPRAFFQCRDGEMQEVLRVQRGIMLSDCLRQAMLRRTESRGTHVRSDFPQTSDAWLKKQVVRVVDGMARFADAPL